MEEDWRGREVTFDTLRESGLTGADERKVRLCSEKIREEDSEKMHFSFI